MKLSESEEMVLCVLLGKEKDPDLETVIKEVNERFNKTWKLQTVATFLTRLKKKGYINIYRIGRYSHYHAAVSLEEYRKEKLQKLTDLLFNGDTELVIKELESGTDEG